MPHGDVLGSGKQPLQMYDHGLNRSLSRSQSEQIWQQSDRGSLAGRPCGWGGGDIRYGMTIDSDPSLSSHNMPQTSEEEMNGERGEVMRKQGK